jgi:hypothetical protein
MASIEAALVAALTGEASVSALAGSRVFPIGGRQGAQYPFITFQRISTQGAAHLDGPSTLDWPRFQLNLNGDTADEARELAEVVLLFLDGREHSAAGMTFTATFQDQRGPTLDEVTKKFGAQQDYLLWHERNLSSGS